MFTALVWLPLKYFGDHFKVSTVWHEEFTWNLILQLVAAPYNQNP